MVQHRTVEQVEAAARGTCLGIGGPIDEVSETGVDHRARAHRARLERDDEGAVVEAPVTDLRGRVAQRQDLGVSCWIAGELALVVARREHVAITHDDRTDGHVAVFEGGARLVERELHPRRVRAWAWWTPRPTARGSPWRREWDSNPR